MTWRPRTHVSVAGRRHGTFYVLGWSGFWLAAVLTLALCAATGLSIGVQAAVAALAAAVYFSIVAIARRRFGRPMLVYYHHILAFLGITALLLALAGEPVLAYLDITVCGVAVFTCVARLGCLAVGCCHGQPGRHGITYGPEHRRTGVPAYLIGVPLIPVQAIESALCVVLATAATVAVLVGAPRGTAFTLFIVGYATGRFGLEWLRGDLARPYLGPLSEAQWISLALVIAVAVASATGLLPGGAVVAASLVVLIAAAVATSLGRHPRHRELLSPPHVRELARRLARLPLSRPGDVNTAVTSQGLRVSLGETGEHAHYTLSTRFPLGDAGDLRLARLVLWICRNDCDPQLLPGEGGVFHVVAPRTPAAATVRHPAGHSSARSG